MINMGNFGGLLGNLMQQGQTPQGQGGAAFMPGNNMQGMGLGSPFFANRPQQVSAPQPFTPTRSNAMSPQAMGLLGMSPNQASLVGPTSALPADQQPMGSQLQMYGMEDQLANQQPEVPGGGGTDNQTLMEQLVDMGLFASNPFRANPGFQTMGFPSDEYLSPDRINSLWTQFHADQQLQGG